ncbi:DUF3857 domain-containing transglutaminase family protein [Mariniflexile litorale]|uniref:DUF3857 domain-containing transglutaminase family protein n=1 Tax=Mariniflexile litorale TaxID=3045158 RepID=A0AAU7EJD3_9FLAO|nr:DUF3857 domain-containing transglutaminase family protein [Mariniflexile sp. KMM 9835]MDQ8210264.1 DUF3857 domain-containing transglutaminase family protein [Mariniflexile sp. KMM 9835]
MKLKLIILYFVLFATLQIYSQENLLVSLTIPANLKENANAVIRSNQIDITINSVNDMTVYEKRIITVLNKEGNSNIDAFVHYDNNVKIKTLEVLVFNQFGAVIKKVKKNDFKDVSAVDGGTLYSDSRVKYLEYTPISYPYTIEFVSEINTKNTAFIESFTPINDHFLSVENSSYTISFPSDITIRTKEKNLEGIDLFKEALQNKISYKVKNIEAIKPEAYSPSLVDIAPKILVTSNKFALEGVQTEVEDWADFGKWMYQDLIKDTHDLPVSTVAMIQNLVKDEATDLDKARKVYDYVQNKTRYISVQVGIGGWKPFKASEVDKLGYGDCKALTNYTMSLLNAAGIQSNYTVVYAGSSQRNLENDFAAMQGNHVILNIPIANEEDIWLECTSQKLPFGFIGDFTDDRDVLVITPEAGKIKHTKKYTTEENTQFINGSYTVSNDGFIDVKITVNSKGIQYDNKYWLETETERDLDTRYKKRWNYVNGMRINNMQINNNKLDNEFVEDVSFVAPNYSKIVGNRMLLTVNALNRNTDIPDRYRDRKLPLKIKRGFKDVDEVEIKLPEGFTIESSPDNALIENKFGSYKIEIVVKDDSTLLYKRELVINDGEYPKEDYETYRDFYKEINKLDNSKIALIKNQ